MTYKPWKKGFADSILFDVFECVSVDFANLEEPVSFRQILWNYQNNVVFGRALTRRDIDSVKDALRELVRLGYVRKVGKGYLIVTEELEEIKASKSGFVSEPFVPFSRFLDTSPEYEYSGEGYPNRLPNIEDVGRPLRSSGYSIEIEAEKPWNVGYRSEVYHRVEN